MLSRARLLDDRTAASGLQDALRILRVKGPVARTTALLKRVFAGP